MRASVSGSPTELRLPKFGLTMEEGTIVAWHKAPGDAVRAGETVAEIETDKATSEIESPWDGTLLSILVQAGVAAEVGTPIAVIAAEGASPPSEADPPATTGGISAHADFSARTGSAGNGVAETPGAAAPAAAGIAPSVRRLAEQLRIDWRSVQGSGEGGRVLADDIRAAAAGRSSPGRPSPSGTPSQRGSRRRIAELMSRSHREIPPVYLSLDVPMEAALAWLASRREGLARETPEWPTLTPLLLRAVAATLREHPDVNAAYDGEQVRRAPERNIAVAVQAPQGLVAPVVVRVDALGWPALVRETNRLIAAARSGALRPADLDGATFTLSNLGAYGVDQFGPLITPPQIAALGVGRLRTTLVLRDGGVHEIPVVTCTLCVDHRVLDGAPAAQFLKVLGAHLEDPDRS